MTSPMASLSRLRHSLTPTQYLASGLAFFTAVFIYDYTSWRSFGGTPPSFLHYLQIQRWTLTFFSHRRTLTDPSSLSSSGPSYIKPRKVPHRKGGRPTLTRWILPQRQRPEAITPSAETSLHTLIQDFTNTPPYSGYLDHRPSVSEGRTCAAIYVKPDIRTVNPAAKSMRYEVAHVHAGQDNSLHVFVSPADAKLVIAREWGQRFPVPDLAPDSWIMVYAPRNEEEVEVVREIVRAGVCFAVGREVKALSGSFQ